MLATVISGQLRFEVLVISLGQEIAKSEVSPAMVPWLGYAGFLCLLNVLCCLSISHGRTAPSTLYHIPLLDGKMREMQLGVGKLKLVEDVFKYNPTTKDISAMKDNIIKLNTELLDIEEESSSLNVGDNKKGAEDINLEQSQNQPSVYLISGLQGKKSSTFWKIVKWVLYVLAGLLALGAVLYIFSMIYVCCRGSQSLAESGHTLGWWPFGYFAHGQQAGYSGVAPEPSRILAGPATPQP